MFEDVLRVVYASCDRDRMDTLFVLNLLLSLFILKCVRNSHERCWSHFCEPKNVLKALMAVPTSKASQNVAANRQRLTFHEPLLCNILILLHFFCYMLRPVSYRLVVSLYQHVACLPCQRSHSSFHFSCIVQTSKRNYLCYMSLLHLFK